MSSWAKMKYLKMYGLTRRYAVRRRERNSTKRTENYSGTLSKKSLNGGLDMTLDMLTNIALVIVIVVALTLTVLELFGVIKCNPNRKTPAEREAEYYSQPDRDKNSITFFD